MRCTESLASLADGAYDTGRVVDGDEHSTCDPQHFLLLVSQFHGCQSPCANSALLIAGESACAMCTAAARRISGSRSFGKLARCMVARSSGVALFSTSRTIAGAAMHMSIIFRRNCQDRNQLTKFLHASASATQCRYPPRPPSTMKRSSSTVARRKTKHGSMMIRKNQKDWLLGNREKKGRGGPSYCECCSRSMWSIRPQSRKPWTAQSTKYSRDMATKSN